MAHARRMPLGGRGQILHAVVDHLHRMPALHRQQRRMRSERRRIIFLAAKRAAGLRLDHAHLVFGQIENREQRLVHVIRALQRTPHRHAALRARTPRSRRCFQCRGAPARRCDTRPRRCVRHRPRQNPHRPFPAESSSADCPSPTQSHLLPLAFFNREDGRQRLVLNLHGCHCFAHLVLVRMRQQHDRPRRSGSPCRQRGRVDPQG